MYHINQFSGAGLPDKTICLTYDDGPGEHTFAIAEFLASKGIRATFFVVGKYAVHYTAQLEAMSKMGHIIANHTYEHPDLPYYVSVGGDVQAQVLRTDAVIKPYAGKTMFFRCPYGKWSAEVANELNSNPLTSLNHIGPIHWDVDGIDCYYWKQGRSVGETVNVYMAKIQEQRKGIVVMHDEIADMDCVKSLNKTLELTMALIPALKDQGYTFVGLDEVPSVAQQINQPCSFTLSSAKGQYLQQAGDQLSFTSRNAGTASMMVLEEMGNGKVAIRVPDGSSITITGENGTRISCSDSNAGEMSMFDLIPIFDNRIVLRCQQGNFWAIDKYNKLVATAQFMRQAAVFRFIPAGAPATRKLSLKQQLNLLVKGGRFVMSKVFKN